MPAALRSVLALDVGSKRIGVAVASLDARLPRPLTTLIATEADLIDTLKEIIKSEDIERIVVGLPRGMEGQSTAQTDYVINFSNTLKEHFEQPIDMQDEALTSKHAEKELDARGKPYKPSDIDALAATYILDDWFAEHRELTH